MEKSKGNSSRRRTILTAARPSSSTSARVESQPSAPVQRSLVSRQIAFWNEPGVNEMGHDFGHAAFNQSFGQNEERNRDQEARISREVVQEWQSHFVPDRQPLHSRKNEERNPGQKNGEQALRARLGDPGLIRPSRCWSQWAGPPATSEKCRRADGWRCMSTENSARKRQRKRRGLSATAAAFTIPHNFRGSVNAHPPACGRHPA